MASVVVLATGAAFGLFFGVFVLALVVLAAVAIRWGIRKDRPAREAWKRRHREAIEAQRRAAEEGRPNSTGQ